MRTRIGTQGGFERVILCTAPCGFYLAVKPWRRYYRIALWFVHGAWLPMVYVGRS